MELGEPIFAVEGYDVGELGCNESCDRLQSVSVVENRSKIYWMDERLKAVQDMFEQQFGAGNARIVSSDLGDRNMLVWVGKTNQTESIIRSIPIRERSRGSVIPTNISAKPK